MNELNEINTCGASITYEVIPSSFLETKDNFKGLYKKLLKILENDAEISADITFGPKALPLMI
jgi:hypothetical protein